MKSPTILIDRQRELSNCNFVKTILMLIVVLYHCILYWNGEWFVGKPIFSAPLLSVAARWMNSFHIYAFTLVSGYLFYYLKCEKGRYNSFTLFVKNKVKRLLIPYAFVSIVWVIPFVVYFYQYDIWRIIINFCLGVSPSQLWFLLMLFDVFLIFWGLSKVFRKHNIYGIAIVLLFYIVGLIGQAAMPNIFQIFRACTYVPFFWIGFKIRQYGSAGLRKIPALIWLLIDIMLFAITQYLYSLGGLFTKLLTLGFSFMLNIVGALMAFVILQKIADCFSWEEHTALRFLGGNSMSIYLFHQQLVYVFIYHLNGVLNPYLHATINFVGAIVVSSFISLLLMKFKCIRFLVGDK